MSSTTEHQDAAIALMKMFTDETAQKYTAEVGGKFPIIKDLDIDYDKAPAQLKYVQDIMDSYNRFYLQLCLTLAACGLRAWTVGYHPTQRAEALPLIPQNRAEALDRYFKNTGACGGQMLRATAATRLSIDYFSEQDFVRKMRAASC